MYTFKVNYGAYDKAIFNGKGPCHAWLPLSPKLYKLQFNYSNDPDFKDPDDSGVIRTSKKTPELDRQDPDDEKISGSGKTPE